jgi:hypothetical protein
MRPRDLDILHACSTIDGTDELELGAATMAQGDFPVPNLHSNEDQDAARVKNLIQLHRVLHTSQEDEDSQDGEDSQNEILSQSEPH